MGVVGCGLWWFGGKEGRKEYRKECGFLECLRVDS